MIGTLDIELNGCNVRQQADEEGKSFELIGSLTSDQLQVAVPANSPADLSFGPGRDGITSSEEGINASELDDKQQKLLPELIGERVGLLNEIRAKAAMDKITANLDETWFAWFGPTQAGEAATFRIQGPTVTIEYAPQQMGGDSANHIHAMYRDPTNDYGPGSIRAHE